MKMKTILIAMALAIASASASAATCTGTMINRDMVTYVQRGMTVNDISGLLVCAPIEAPGGFAWETRDATMRRQIVVDFAGSVAIQARYQEIPLSPGDTGGRDVAAAAALIALAAARGYFTGSAEASGCTPAQVNEAAQRRIMPGMLMAGVIAAIGCKPMGLVPAPVGMLASWYVAGLGEAEGGGLHVFFDGAGAAFTFYFPPLAVPAHSSQLRGFPGVTPPWVRSAGAIVPTTR